MGKILIPGGGGGADLDVITATSPDIRKGKVIVGPDGEPLTGTMPENPSPTATLQAGQSKQIPLGYNPGGTVTAASLSSQTSGTATAAQILSGKTAWVNGSKLTGSMGDYSGKNSTSNYVSSTFRSATTGYVFASPGSTGYYSNGSYLRIPASNLAPDNIKKGVSIMGITGTWEGYVTSPLYLYNKGTWNGLQTTGFSVVDGAGNYIELESHIRFTCSGVGNKYVVTRSNSPFLFSGRSYLKLNMSVDNLIHYTNEVYIGLSPNPSLTRASISSLSAKIIIGKDQDTGTINIIPIGSISGNHYIYVAIINGTSGSAGETETVSIDQIFVTNN